MWLLNLLDCRRAFAQVHSPGLISSLPPKSRVGPVDPLTLPEQTTGMTEEEMRMTSVRAALPPPSVALNLRDIEVYILLW